MKTNFHISIYLILMMLHSVSEHTDIMYYVMCVTQELACHHTVIRTNASSLLALSYVQIHYFDENVFKVMINEMIDVL